MARLNECHQKLNNGVGKCSVPMWMNGLPAGFCDDDAYGEQTEYGKFFYKGYVPALACQGHGGPDKQEPTEQELAIKEEEKQQDIEDNSQFGVGS